MGAQNFNFAPKLSPKGGGFSLAILYTTLIYETRLSTRLGSAPNVGFLDKKKIF